MFPVCITCGQELFREESMYGEDDYNSGKARHTHKELCIKSLQQQISRVDRERESYVKKLSYVNREIS